MDSFSIEVTGRDFEGLFQSLFGVRVKDDIGGFSGAAREREGESVVGFEVLRILLDEPIGLSHASLGRRRSRTGRESCGLCDRRQGGHEHQQENN